MKILGYTDSRNECDKCGKEHLKGTYAIQTNDGDIFYLGSTCVMKGYHLDSKEFTAKKNKDKEQQIIDANKEWKLTEEYKMDRNQQDTGDFLADMKVNLKNGKIIRAKKEEIAKKYFILTYRVM